MKQIEFLHPVAPQKVHLFSLFVSHYYKTERKVQNPIPRRKIQVNVQISQVSNVILFDFEERSLNQHVFAPIDRKPRVDVPEGLESDALVKIIVRAFLVLLVDSLREAPKYTIEPKRMIGRLTVYKIENCKPAAFLGSRTATRYNQSAGRVLQASINNLSAGLLKNGLELGVFIKDFIEFRLVNTSTS